MHLSQYDLRITGTFCMASQKTTAPNLVCKCPQIFNLLLQASHSQIPITTPTQLRYTIDNDGSF